MGAFPEARPSLPFITADQMREVDRAMIEDHEIQLIQMMENAGRHLAHLARVRFLDGNPTGRRVLTLAGTGGNGGGGLACARRLHGWGAGVEVRTSRPAEAYQGVPGQQLNMLLRLGLPIAGPANPGVPDVDLVIDAIIGYSLAGSPRGGAALLIELANRVEAPVLSLDTPSGIDTNGVMIHEPAVRATATLTLALPKRGLRSQEADPYVGELYLADIGVPPGLYAGPGLGLEVGPLFAESEILRVQA